MKTGKLKIILTVLIIFVICFTSWVLWANTALMVSEFTIASERVPKAFDGYTIAQVSDLHNAEFGEDNIRLLDLIERQEPDIIVITGDIIDSRKTDFDVSLKFCENAIKIAPTYYVNGNHEQRIANFDIFEKELIDIGIIVLNDEMLEIKRDSAVINLLGIEDPNFRNIDYLFDDSSYLTDGAIKSIDYDKNNFTILLSHRPELFDTYVENKIDLSFTGHAHGGQFRLPFLGGVAAPNQGVFPKFVVTPIS